MDDDAMATVDHEPKHVARKRPSTDPNRPAAAWSAPASKRRHLVFDEDGHEMEPTHLR